MKTLAQAAVFVEPGRPLELRTIAIPDLQSGEILVQVLACTICGSDLHSFHGRRCVPTPTILGHEIIAEVVGFAGDNQYTDLRGANLKRGDRVTWSLCIHCGSCAYCGWKLPQKCMHLRKFGHEQIVSEWAFSGGLAEFCVLPKGTCIVKLSDTVSDEQASPLSCATATVAAALRSAGPAKNMIVIGAGALGVTACSLATAKVIIAIDPRVERQEVARQCGATHALSSQSKVSDHVRNLTEGHGADVVLEMSGTSEGVELATKLARIGGTIVLVGAVAPTRPVPIEPEMIVRRMLTIRGVHNYGPEDLIAAVDFVEQGRTPVGLVGAAFSLSQVNEAFAWATANPGMRAMVKP